MGQVILSGSLMTSPLLISFVFAKLLPSPFPHLLFPLLADFCLLTRQRVSLVKNDMEFEHLPPLWPLHEILVPF